MLSSWTIITVHPNHPKFASEPILPLLRRKDHRLSGAKEYPESGIDILSEGDAFVAAEMLFERRFR